MIISQNKKSVKIARRQDGRYIIVDATTNDIIDDAQGHGFKSEQSAVRYVIPKDWHIINQPTTPAHPECYELF